MDFLAVQGTLKSLLQHHSSKASITWCSALTHKLHDIILSYPSFSDFSSPLPPHRPFFSFQRLKFPRSRTLSSFSSHSSCPPHPPGTSYILILSVAIYMLNKSRVFLTAETCFEPDMWTGHVRDAHNLADLIKAAASSSLCRKAQKP